jgi:hypothetical protein
MNVPGHGAVAAWALEAVAALPIRNRPWRLVNRHAADLPRRRARIAEQERQCDVAANS